jgi:CheY-like chemotaxis protein
MLSDPGRSSRREMELARVLLVDDDDATRLTLKVVLEASGYYVSAARSAAEAVAKIDEQQYDLVLCDLHLKSKKELGTSILAHARSKCYEPATALISSEQHGDADPNRPMLIAPEAVPELLAEVADLISSRAARMVEQGLKAARSKAPRIAAM